MQESYVAARAAQGAADRHQAALDALDRASGSAALELEEVTAAAAVAQGRMQQVAYRLGQLEERRTGVAAAAERAAHQAEVAHQQAAAAAQQARQQRDRS